jgi:hypothetical protein
LAESAAEGTKADNHLSDALQDLRVGHPAIVVK